MSMYNYKDYYRRKYIDKDYYVIHLPEHPFSNSNGVIFIHRLEAEKIVGRYLNPSEVVHHIDENKLNNNLNNLMIFKSNRDHILFHKGYNKLICKDNIYEIDPECIKEKQKNEYYNCSICGKELKKRSRYTGMCSNCFKKYKETFIMYNNKFDKNNLIRKPTEYQLKKLIYNLPFTTIGKKYNVSDKAVEKWCTKYGIDYHYDALKNNSEREIYKTEIIRPIIQKKINPFIIQPIRFE